MNLISLGLLLIFLGFILVFADIFISIVRASRVQTESREEKEERKTEAGGIIFIGPIPIIFGTSKKNREMDACCGLSYNDSSGSSIYCSVHMSPLTFIALITLSTATTMAAVLRS